MRKILCSLALSAVVLAVTSCMEEEARFGKASLEVDVASIELEADNALQDEPYEQTPSIVEILNVTSSRSWTVSVKTEDGGNWLRPSVKERLNLSGKPETFPLELTADRYRGHEAREAVVSIYAADMEAPLTVPVTQKPYVPYLEIIADTDVVVPALDGVCRVVVKSNAVWSAHIDKVTSTVEPALSAIAGEDTKEMVLTFPANMDEQQTRTAVLVVEAEGCEPESVALVQGQSESYFHLAAPVPSEILPYESSWNIPLRSNGAWTAELTECTFENAYIEPISGFSTLDGINFYADHGSDPQLSEKKATVVIKRDGKDDIVVSFSQRGSIHLSISSFDPEYEWTGRETDTDNPYKPYISNGYPFVTPSSLPLSMNANLNVGVPVDCVMKAGGYVFTMFGKDCGVWLTPNTFCLQVGKTKDDYVLFPAIEGYRLSKMYYEASCRASNPYTVRTEDGKTVIKGGEKAFTKKVVPVDTNHHDMHVHVFPDTEAGARYRLNVEDDYRYISIKDLCLVYDKID